MAGDGVADNAGSVRLCSPLAKDLGTMPNVSYKYIKITINIIIIPK